MGECILIFTNHNQIESNENIRIQTVMKSFLECQVWRCWIVKNKHKKKHFDPEM